MAVCIFYLRSFEILQEESHNNHARQTTFTGVIICCNSGCWLNPHLAAIYSKYRSILPAALDFVTESPLEGYSILEISQSDLILAADYLNLAVVKHTASP